MKTDIKCDACNGTGDMDAERADQLSAAYRQPVCIAFGCEDCGGYGTVDADDDCDGLVEARAA